MLSISEECFTLAQHGHMPFQCSLPLSRMLHLYMSLWTGRGQSAANEPTSNLAGGIPLL